MLVAITSSCDGGATQAQQRLPRSARAADRSPISLGAPLFGECEGCVGALSGPAISADGSTIVFSSEGRLTRDDSDDDSDVFVYERATREITLASSGGGDAYAEERSVSADGSRVLFTSGANDERGHSDVYLADRRARTVTRVSLRPDGSEIGGISYMAALSGDGRVVAFTTHADGVVASDRNRVRDLYVRDLVTGAVERASIGPRGQSSIGQGVEPLGISHDGSRVVFFANELVPGSPRNSSSMAELDWFLRGSGSARFGVDLWDLRVWSVAADGRSVVGVRHSGIDAVRIDLETGAESSLIPAANDVDAIAISPDANVIAVVANTERTNGLLERSLHILRGGEVVSTRPLAEDVAGARVGWHSFAVANDGTVVARVTWVRPRGPGEWSYSKCVAMLAPRPQMLACGAPGDREEDI